MGMLAALYWHYNGASRGTVVRVVQLQWCCSASSSGMVVPVVVAL